MDWLNNNNCLQWRSYFVSQSISFLCRGLTGGCYSFLSLLLFTVQPPDLGAFLSPPPPLPVSQNITQIDATHLISQLGERGLGSINYWCGWTTTELWLMMTTIIWLLFIKTICSQSGGGLDTTPHHSLWLFSCSITVVDIVNNISEFSNGWLYHD